MQTVVMQPPPVVVPQQQRSLMNVNAIRGLGIAQICIGSLTLLLGIIAIAALSYDYWLQRSGGGIWGGLWILVTGIIGLVSSYKTDVGSLNGLNMAFNIIATIVAFLDGIFFAIGLGYYNNCKLYHYYSWYSYSHRNLDYGCFDDRNAGRGIYATLMLLMISEFFIALVAAVYCCQATGSCCGTTGSRGIILQQQPNVVMSNTTGHMVVSAPPTTSYVTTTQYNYPQQHVVMQPQQPMPPHSMGPPQQPMPPHSMGPPHQPMPPPPMGPPHYPTQPTATTMTYSSQNADYSNAVPPPYSQ